MPAVNGVEFLANKIQRRYDRTVVPTLETLPGTDSLGMTISAGGVAPDLLDTHPKARITVDDGGGASSHRYDVDLDEVIAADFAIIANHTTRESMNHALGDAVGFKIYHDSDAAFAGATELTQTQHYSGLVGKDRPYLEFDGTNDKATVTDSAHLDPGNGDSSFEVLVSFDNADEDHYIIGRRTDADNRLYLAYLPASGIVGVWRVGGTTLHSVIVTFTPVVGQIYHIVWTIDNGTSNALYVDGVAQTLASEDKIGGDMSLSDSMEFGERGDAADFAKINLYQVRLWNRALTSAQVTNLYNGDLVPAADQWGSQTELVANGTFAAWTADDPDSWTISESAPDPEISQVGTGEGHGGSGTGYCNIYSTSTTTYIQQTVVLTVGKKYRLSINVDNVTSGTIRVEDQSGNGNFSNFNLTATGISRTEFTATGNILLRIRRNATTCDVTIDDVSVVQIGCVGEWSPDGINPNDGAWYNSGGNAGSATISGATEKDTADATDGDLTVIEFAEAEDRYWFFEVNTTPDATSPDFEVGQIAIGKRFAPTTAPTLTVPEHHDYSGVKLTTTRGGRRSSNQRYGRRRRWELRWDYITEREKSEFEALLEDTQGREFPFWFTLNSNDPRPIFYYGRIVNSPTFASAASQVYRVVLVLEEEI